MPTTHNSNGLVAASDRTLAGNGLDRDCMGDWPKNKHGNSACPCCGYHTLVEEPPATFGICPICDWEEDCVPVSHWDMRCWGAANGGISIFFARQNFERYGSMDDLKQSRERKTIHSEFLPRHDWKTDPRPFPKDDLKDA